MLILHQSIENVSQTCSVYMCNMNHTCTSCQPARFIHYINCRIRSLQFTCTPPPPPPKKKQKQQILKLPHKI